MKRSKTSKAWMREHVNDVYVKKAKQEGYRSRAAYKLLEIDEKDRLLRRGMFVVDLGATPGGWSQVAADAVGREGRVVAMDILEMTPPAGVTFILGDFREESTLQALAREMQGGKVDLVISDMAPNISGVGVSDQARSIHLAELALDFAVRFLKPGGNFLVKVFQGSGFEDYLRAVRAEFAHVSTRKPKASRDRSSELYLLAKGLRASEE